LDCGDALVVEVSDGKLLKIDPPEIIAYVPVPLRNWMENWAFT